MANRSTEPERGENAGRRDQDGGRAGWAELGDHAAYAPAVGYHGCRRPYTRMEARCIHGSGRVDDVQSGFKRLQQAAIGFGAGLAEPGMRKGN